MAVDQSKTFYIDGFPVTYQQIETWYEKYKLKTAKNTRRLPDPYFNEKSCWFIAGEIVKEFQKPLKNKMFDSTMTQDYNQGQVNKYAIKKSDYWSDEPEIFGETDDLINKTLAEMEQKYREKQEAEALRKKQAAEFWRQQQKQYSVPPPPVQKPKEEKPFDWRKVLNVPSNITMTLDIIKKAYRKEAMKRHPDRGGSTEKMMELFKARDTACYLIGEDPREHFR